jgi:hypothetical protein
MASWETKFQQFYYQQPRDNANFVAIYLFNLKAKMSQFHVARIRPKHKPITNSQNNKLTNRQ